MSILAKGAVIGALALVALGTASTTASAQPFDGRGGGWHHGWHHGPGFGGWHHRPHGPWGWHRPRGWHHRHWHRY